MSLRYVWNYRSATPHESGTISAVDFLFTFPRSSGTEIISYSGDDSWLTNDSSGNITIANPTKEICDPMSGYGGYDGFVYWFEVGSNRAPSTGVFRSHGGDWMSFGDGDYPNNEYDGWYAQITRGSVSIYDKWTMGSDVSSISNASSSTYPP